MNLFSLNGKVAVITGGGGMLGFQHAAAIVGAGGEVALLDINSDALAKNATLLNSKFGCEPLTLPVDITKIAAVEASLPVVLERFSAVDILINNAARNPKIEDTADSSFSRLENFSEQQWKLDLDVGLGGAFNCSKIYGTHMAQAGNGGIIVNIASDLGVIAPDQRIYEGSLYLDRKINTPAVYSASKAGVIGLTKHLAAYWAEKNIRVNSLTPGGIESGQNEQFKRNYSARVPMGRMASANEIVGALLYLASDASSYVTGQNIIVDGGLACW
jgi:NAD(P)-dependent dehydrogenase (short-subunit alcohol dehydrogenase family)